MNRPLMIFAAGFGTRMKPLTDHCPKPLIEVAGRALLDHALALSEPANASPIVVNAHYKAGMIEAHFKGTSVTVVTEGPEILDTGGGLRNALPFLGSGDVATLNSDAVWENESALNALWAHWNPAVMDALLCVIPVSRVLGHKGVGDFDLSTDGQLAFRSGASSEFVYSGLQIIKTATVSEISEPVFSLKLVWEQLAGTGRLFGYVHDSRWCDVGHPEAIPIAETLIADRTHV